MDPIPIENDETSFSAKEDCYITDPGVVLVVTETQNPLEIRAEDLNMSVTEPNEDFETFYDEVFEITLPSTLWAIQRFDFLL